MHEYADTDWWKNKIERLSEKAFHPNVGRWAIRIFEKLIDDADGVVIGEKPRDLARQLDVPMMHVMRSLALMARPGLVTLAHYDDVGWKVKRTRSGTKKPAGPKRKAPTQIQRSALFAAEAYQCGQCCGRFPANQLCIDHLVPLAMLGADEAGNWGALCRKCNRNKWHNFDKKWLKYYRGKRVAKSVGVVIVGGSLWPRINGTIRCQSRARLVETATKQSAR